jgi:hypothetical protein
MSVSESAAAIAGGAQRWFTDARVEPMSTIHTYVDISDVTANFVGTAKRASGTPP